MMDRLNNPSKLEAFRLSEELKTIMKPLFQKHMDDIMSGAFSKRMMEDWKNGDEELLSWRHATKETAFEKTTNTLHTISEQEFFDHGILMVSFVKAGVELAYDTMTATGIIAESAYYESLHEAPLIANTIARKKLHEMNRIISDTAEYGCYLFDHACQPLLVDFMKNVEINVIGSPFSMEFQVDNMELIQVNKSIREHEIEIVGTRLREAMTDMKKLN
jgi:ketol-acid reductoisomerase